MASDDWQQALPKVKQALKWDAVIDSDKMIRETGLAPEQVRAALAALGARGLVGFDLESQSYFHRELPFDLSLLDEHQPRLKGARKLLDDGKVRIGSRSDDQIELFVEGTGVEHRVRVADSGSRCTCPWFSKHQVNAARANTSWLPRCLSISTTRSLFAATNVKYYSRTVGTSTL